MGRIAGVEQSSGESKTPLNRLRSQTSMSVWSWGYEGDSFLFHLCRRRQPWILVDAAGMKGDAGNSTSADNHRGYRKRKQQVVHGYAEPGGVGPSLKTKRKVRSQAKKDVVTNVPGATRSFDDKFLGTFHVDVSIPLRRTPKQ